MTYQPFPPDDHQHNISETLIQTWNDQFIGVLTGTASTSPMNLWGQLIPQTEKQISMFIKLRENPNKSAYVHLYGPHNYNVLPYVPIGMESLIHEKPTRCKTLSEHSKKKYLIVTSCENYRCWNLWEN